MVESTTLGLKSKTYAILILFKSRAEYELPEPIFTLRTNAIAEMKHLFISFAGMLNQAVETVFDFMEFKTDTHFYEINYGDQCKPLRLLSEDMEKRSQDDLIFFCARVPKLCVPYNLGMLVAGYDEEGIHIFHSGPLITCDVPQAVAIGRHAQPARTYLATVLEDLSECDRKALIGHGLVALTKCLPADVKLSSKNVSIAVVCADGEWPMLNLFEDDGVQPFLDDFNAPKAPMLEEQPPAEVPMPEDQPPAKEKPQQLEGEGEKMES